MKTIVYKKELLDYTKKLLSQIKPNTIILLNGNLGSGKTTTIQNFGKALNIKENMTSPTFNIMNEYEGQILNEKEYTSSPTSSLSEKIFVYHFDLYRISEEYFEELESLEEPFIMFVEWYDKISLNWKSWAKNNNAKIYKLNITIQFEEDVKIDEIENLPRVFLWEEI